MGTQGAVGKLRKERHYSRPYYFAISLPLNLSLIRLAGDTLLAVHGYLAAKIN